MPKSRRNRCSPLVSTGPASKTTRLATFPPYLLLQIRRFGVNPDWTPKKLDVHLQVYPNVWWDFFSWCTLTLAWTHAAACTCCRWTTSWT